MHRRRIVDAFDAFLPNSPIRLPQPLLLYGGRLSSDVQEDYFQSVLRLTANAAQLPAIRDWHPRKWHLYLEYGKVKSCASIHCRHLLFFSKKPFDVRLPFSILLCFGVGALAPSSISALAIQREIGSGCTVLSALHSPSAATCTITTSYWTALRVIRHFDLPACHRAPTAVLPLHLSLTRSFFLGSVQRTSKLTSHYIAFVSETTHPHLSRRLAIHSVVRPTKFALCRHVLTYIDAYITIRFANPITPRHATSYLDPYQRTLSLPRPRHRRTIPQVLPSATESLSAAQSLYAFPHSPSISVVKVQ